jgi:hypothetical protein
MSSKVGKDVGNVNDLFEEAHAEGVLSPSSLQALTGVDLGAQIQAALGISVDDVHASEVVLLTIMPDDSGSIRQAGNEQAVRDGHNLVLDALTRSKQGDGVLAHTRYLGGSVLFPYRPIDQAVRMTAKNYEAIHGTPLYDQSVVLLGSVLAKAQEFTRNGVPTRSATLIITDGADQHSHRAKAEDVATLVADMTRSEAHIVAAMGISDESTDFKAVFRRMGIDDRWILTPANDPSEIRRAFQVFSQSAVRASRSVSFSRGGLGGFVN